VSVKEVDSTDLYRLITAKILECAEHAHKERNSLRLQNEFWDGYAEALCWVRDELLELEAPAAKRE
jgi:hypothetical protein